MPRKVTIDGVEVEVFDAAEVTAARETAAAAARQEAETARQAAEAARTAAEQERDTLKASVDTEKAGKAAAERRLQGVRLLSAPEVGLRPDQAEQVLGLPMFAEVDLSDETARKGAVDALKATFPQLFAKPGEGDGGEFGGMGGSPTGGNADPDPKTVEGYSQEQYEAWRANGAK